MTAATVDHFETVWIPMSDGIRLAARMWRPSTAATHPVPAILEYIPYRRRDGNRERDQHNYSFLAAHGYAGIRLDMRGSGDSEGILRDEYLKQEQDDAVEAIAWIAAQPWCDGSVGMMGISWGGFNALQVAARRPPALKAIVTLCSTDDRYADDIHYMGGCQLTGNLEWRSTLFTLMGLAPDPMVVADRWRAMWLQRLEAVVPMVSVSLAHQRRDGYWKHGSVCEDIGAIRCAVLAVGGWADGYSNAIFRLLRDLKAPRAGIVGPWGHKYPNYGVPGPAIGFLTEMLRWWDYWLKGIETKIMQEPMLRAYVQDWIAPASHYAERPGHWVGETSWPSAQIGAQRWYLNPTGLESTPASAAPLAIRSPLTIGAAGGEWCAYSLGGLGPELPTDQRQDDGYSLVFDSAPLTVPLEILGAPILEVAFCGDRPVMQMIVRLNDVAADGQVARVTYGMLNLAHRNSHEQPEKIEPGQLYTARLQLNEIGHRFAPGHRLRIAISTSYWPMVWPAPEQGVLQIIAGSSNVLLPVRSMADGERRVEFPPPEPADQPARTVLRRGEAYRKYETDVGSGVQRLTVLRDDGLSVIDDIGVEVGFRKTLRYRIDPSDPTSARAEADYDEIFRHSAGWDTRVKTRSAIACTTAEYIVESDLEAFEGEQRIFSRSWTQRIPRDFT